MPPSRRTRKARTVFLKLQPVDPYNIMSGYYMTLSYEIASPQPVADWTHIPEDAPVYIVLAEGPDGCWHAESIHETYPNVSADQVVIRGTRQYGRIDFGIESYFVPETMRQEIAHEFRTNQDSARAEVRVDASGRAAVVSLVFGDKVYQY